VVGTAPERDGVDDVPPALAAGAEVGLVPLGVDWCRVRRYPMPPTTSSRMTNAAMRSGVFFAGG
jgi:hypothetical protein